MENLVASRLISAFEVYKKMNSNNKKTKNKGKSSDLSLGVSANSRQIKKPKNAKTTSIITKSSNTNKAINKNVKIEKNTNSDDEQPPKLIPIDVVKIKQQNGDDRKEKMKFIEPNVSNDDPTTNSQRLLQWLISPTKLDTFFNKYWEKHVLHVKRGKPNYYTHIFDSKHLDKMIRENPLYYTKNVDVVAYEDGVKETFNQDGRAVPSALWDFYANGCSIRILNPQTYNNKVHLVLATLQEYFGTMVGANVYLTPPNSQGFAPHFDDIEAFVIQLEGRKHWKLYHPKESDVLTRESSGNFKRDDLGAPFKELTLEAGDVLYFPRGTIHEGCTDADAHSLHITVSVYQHTAYVDLLENILPNALKKASENDVEFRKGLPLNYLKHLGAINADKNSTERTNVINNVKKLLKSLIDYVDVDSGADDLGKKFMHDSMPPVCSRSEAERTCKGDGDRLENGKVINRVEIGLDTKVRLLRYHCLRLVLDTPPKIYYNTENANVYHGEEEQWLELEPRMVEVIKMLQNQFPKFMDVESLPIDDVTEKLQLVSDLWEHGLIITERPLDVVDDESNDDDDDDDDYIYEISE